ncbi:MAG: STAS domain-containing protein [Desulfobacterales bacterium]|nr:STAS domain-containing protein [Desulfobacterales bacterium]
MEIIEKKQNDILIFRLNGRLDSNTSPGLEEKIFEAIESGSYKMIIDFEALDYISSAGLRVLNKSIKRLKHNEGMLILCSMQDYIKEVFEIAGFDSFLTIVSTVDEALTKL